MSVSDFLQTPIKFLKGVGPEREVLLKTELGIQTFGELLIHFPFRYVDRTKFYKVKELMPDMTNVQLRGKISRIEMVSKGTRRLVVEFADETGRMELIWFQGIKWITPKLKPNTEYIVFGKPTLFGQRFSISHPELEEATDENIKLSSHLQPVYHTTEKMKRKWMDSNGVWKIQRALVSQINGNIPELLSTVLIQKHKLISREEALKNIHLPQDPEILKRSEFRLKFEELFFLQLRLLQLKALRNKNYPGFNFSTVGNTFNDFYNNRLPFPLTGAQKKVLKEIRADMVTGHQMNRLLQGDVGSGKTIVALMSILIAIDSGFQACIMAPTEILAQQHYKNISKLVSSTTISVRLLTGSTKKSERKEIYEKLKTGEIHILIGTHALLEEKVQFLKLGFAVIDEQHKFGVAHRSKLWKKSAGEEGVFIPPHILIMTATPIPRTLAMTLYGDLDVSVIDELPPGRTPIKTAHRYDVMRIKVFEFMKEQISKGRQVYVVYPIIEESKVLDYENLREGFETILKYFPQPDYKVSMVHGQLPNASRDFNMKEFVEGRTQILVATTVIEVGVDVPNATLMVIESSERFGLSQLHQLRGRVGRGAEESYCILMTGYKLSADARIRTETMVRTTDGFEIAEVDLGLRGPGDMAGTQQSGSTDLHIADIVKDSQILHFAREVALQLLKEDADLLLPDNQPILVELNRIKKTKPYWGRIS